MARAAKCSIGGKIFETRHVQFPICNNNNQPVTVPGRVVAFCLANRVSRLKESREESDLKDRKA